MLFIVVYIQVVQVLSEVPPAPPQDIHVDNWLLTWTPATEERDVSYTIQYRSFTDVWQDVPACVQLTCNYCNVTLIKDKGEQGCVRLRVQAERRGLTSRPVEACSRHGDSCTPEFSLTARPGSLTVHFRRNNSMVWNYGGHASHLVYYGKEGEPLTQKIAAAFTVFIPKLLEGQRYCAKVQYTYYDIPVGLPSCTQCEVIPESRIDQKQSQIIVAVVVVVLLLILIPVIAYILIFQRGRIKHWLRPPCQIPGHFVLEPFPEHYNPIPTSSPSEEHWDVISCITPEEFRE